MSTPTPAEATALLEKAGAAGRRVRAGSGSRTGAWLTGMAAATWGYLTALGVAGGSDERVLLVSAVFAATVLLLSLGLLPGVRVNRAGFGRRWVGAVVGWGVLYAAALVLGLVLMRDTLAYWPAAGLVAALPLALGARAELRS
ncbi:hypothetical protein [Kineococcus glutinatus]|uniref:hypothetical protein n=1 Tax=Kineococcus glutinatus TaxID=1070872 RepID=UPI0031EC9873